MLHLTGAVSTDGKIQKLLCLKGQPNLPPCALEQHEGTSFKKMSEMLFFSVVTNFTIFLTFKTPYTIHFLNRRAKPFSELKGEWHGQVFYRKLSKPQKLYTTVLTDHRKNEKDILRFNFVQTEVKG